MVEESESYSDIDMEMQPKLTFEELRHQVLKDPKSASKKVDLLKTLYYYSKDTKKHTRIIKVLFWALIVPLLQDTKSNQTALFGLKSLNQLILNESAHEHIIGVGRATKLAKNPNISKMIKKAAQVNMMSDAGQMSPAYTQFNEETSSKLNTMIESKQNPVHILANIVLKTDSVVIMVEASKAIKNLSVNEEVIRMLMHEKELLKIFKEKFKQSDSQSQEHILMTVSAACKNKEYRQVFAQDDDFVKILLSQIKSISKAVTYQSLRICRQLAQDESSLDLLQSKTLRLSHQLIYAFQWMDGHINFHEEQQANQHAQLVSGPATGVATDLVSQQNNQNQMGQPHQTTATTNNTFQNANQQMIQAQTAANATKAASQTQNNQNGLGNNGAAGALNESGVDEVDSDLIFREIAKSFEYILKYYDIHKSQLEAYKLKQANEEDDQSDKAGGGVGAGAGANAVDEQDELDTETQIIQTIVQLGRSTRDTKTTLCSATSLSHITEVLDCNEMVATEEAIEFMIDMLKDTKNLRHHRQGCRYFANLSFYSNFRDKLIKKEIAMYLLRAIDGNLDEDTVKHSAIALANLSSHKDFMRSQASGGSSGGPGMHESVKNSKAEKWMIKPLIHLLDSAQVQKIDLIQSACITLCNMASKPSLHKHFIQEPEISTFKNCLENPIDKGNGNGLTRFMIKLVCNLTKNPEVLPHLLKKDFLEILFGLLNHEREKEIFGNVVTAIAYLSVMPEAQQKIIDNKIIPKILEPLTQIQHVDQKMIIIAITSMLFNGIQLQKVFIEHNGLGKLLFFLQQKDKIFYQLACKCFSLLSENEENLQQIIDQECLNTIIISCLRSKDIDLETLKEITKIFINLILWRKLKSETIETTCCLCDIGLMIDDIDMNILAMFCLNALSEDEKNHEKIIQQGGQTSQQNIEEQERKIANDLNRGSKQNNKVDPKSFNKYQLMPASKSKTHQESQNSSGVQSIFPRINFLLENVKQEKGQTYGKVDAGKKELLITLITSFFLNLARNKNNREFLLKLKLFHRLNDLMQREIDNQKTLQINKTALCYTNTIFSKLLKYQESRSHCIKEGGYKLFISILEDKENKHLFLETLDSIKLFLSRREYLSKFQSIPKCIQFDRDCQELNVSFLQVLAILSFERNNHVALKEANLLEKLENEGIFKQIFEHFNKQMDVDERADKDAARQQNSLGFNRTTTQSGSNNQRLISKRKRISSMDYDSVSEEESADEQDRDVSRTGKERQKRRKKDLHSTRQVELALAVSIILSNLSNDEEYIKTLLGVHHWKSRLEQEIQEGTVVGPGIVLGSGSGAGLINGGGTSEDIVINPSSGNAGANNQSSSLMGQNKQSATNNSSRLNKPSDAAAVNRSLYDDAFILRQPEVQRMIGMLNLLSSKDVFISEQISILLANVSNSAYFRYKFISDRCIKSIIKILRFKSRRSQTEVSLLAILIAILNLSACGDIVQGIENLQFLNSLEDIIRNEAKPLENRSIALMAISNIFTQSKQITITDDTKEFAFNILCTWKEKHREQKVNYEVIKNLVYAALILFYNIMLRQREKDIVEKLIGYLNDHIMDYFDDAIIVNVVLQLITLLTKDQETVNILFYNKKIINYIFSRLKMRDDDQEAAKNASLALGIPTSMATILKSPSAGVSQSNSGGYKARISHPVTIKLATIALSRLASKFDANNINSTLYIEQLKNFDNFEFIIKYVTSMQSAEMLAKLAGVDPKNIILQDTILAGQQDFATQQSKTAQHANLTDKLGEDQFRKTSMASMAAEAGPQKGTTINNGTGQSQKINGGGGGPIYEMPSQQTAADTLRYLLIVIENITAKKLSRDVLDCTKLFTEVKELYADHLLMANKKSLINLMFNLNFNLSEPNILSCQFLKLLFKTYNDEKLQCETIKRKIISIVVVASALETNHDAIIKSHFYTQFKMNINDEYETRFQEDEEIELFGLVNIALNKRKMDKIYTDLKKIHKIAVKNPKIDFKNKIDLFTEISKYVAKLTQVSLNQINQKSAQDLANKIDNGLRNEKLVSFEENARIAAATFNDDESEENIKIKECLKALIFTLVRLTVQIDTKNFAMFKYFLLAILDCTKNLKHHLKYIIKIKKILNFLKEVLETEYIFEVEEFEDQNVLNFSLKMIVCEILFNLKFEKEFFKQEGIADSISLLVQFSQNVLKMNIEKKTQLVSNTLRLLSQLITTIHNEPDAGSIIKQTNAIQLVKSALQIQKDLQPCINIDALFCLNNLMNIPELAVDAEFCKADVLTNVFMITYAFEGQVNLDECLITYLFSISKYGQYHVFLKDQKMSLFSLLRRHVDLSGNEPNSESCRQKLFSIFLNMTESQEICKQIDVREFIAVANKMLEKTKEKVYRSDNIHELAIKSLINMCQYQQESIEDVDLKELLKNMADLYPMFKNLAKQYALRLVTILTRQWKPPQLENYLEQLVQILSEFVSNCTHTIEIQLVLINLEKIAFSKRIMKMLPETEKCESLIEHITEFLHIHMSNSEFFKPAKQLIRFCKKLSKEKGAQEFLIKKRMHEIALVFISNSKETLTFEEQEEEQLKTQIQIIQNVMKLVKNLYEGTAEDSMRDQICEVVQKHEEIIDKVDGLLFKQRNNDEMAVKIVNIIINYNSIVNMLDVERVRLWIDDFSERLIESTKVIAPEKNSSTVQPANSYLESYVFILELLVTKNLDKVDSDMTKKLLNIYHTELRHQSKIIWYKMLKILAHLVFLQDLFNQIDEIDCLFEFIRRAHEKANENLSFLYFMRVTMLLTKKTDNSALFQNSKYFKDMLLTINQFFEKQKHETSNELVMEILLYIIDYWRFLMNYQALHPVICQYKVISTLISMLKFHKNEKIVRALSITLQTASQTVEFYPDLLSDDGIQQIIEKMFDTSTQVSSLEPLFECINNILHQTKTPIKYLLASNILQRTEQGGAIDWKNLNEINLIFVLKVLNANILMLEASQIDFDKTTSNVTAQEVSQVAGQKDQPLLLQKEQSSLHKGASISGPINSVSVEINYNLGRRQSEDLDNKIEPATSKSIKSNVPSKSGLEVVQTDLQFQGIGFKAHKYSYLAMTNILALARQKCLIFTRHSKLNLLNLLFSKERNTFESDPQMTLRFLCIVMQALMCKQVDWSTIGENVIEKLIDFLLNNIHKFRNLLESDETFFYQLPDICKQSQKSQQKMANQEDYSFKIDPIPTSQAGQTTTNQIERNQSTNEISNDILSSPKKRENETEYKMHNVGSGLVSSKNTNNQMNESGLLDHQNSPGDFSELVIPCPQDLFFFEVSKNEQALIKLDSIRISLCLSIRIIYKLSELKKRPVCNFIVNHSLFTTLFKFFKNYENNQDQNTLNYIQKIVQILQNCANLTNLHSILLRCQIVHLLTHIAKLIQEKNLGENTLEIRRGIIIPILKTLNFLCQEGEDEWHTTKHSAFDFINTIRESKEDKEISAEAEEIFRFYDSIEETESQDFDIGTELKNILEEQPQNQFKKLSNIDLILRQHKSKLESGSVGNAELFLLLQIFNQEISAGNTLSKQATNTKLIVLKILCFIYEHKFLQQSVPLHLMFNYQDSLKQLISLEASKPQIEGRKQSVSLPSDHLAVNHRGQTHESKQLVSCVIEVEETFKALLNTVQATPNSNYFDLLDSLLCLIQLYSKSNTKVVSCVIDYIFPIFSIILKVSKTESAQKEEKFLSASAIERVNKIVDSLINFLSKSSHQKLIVEQYEIATLLTKILFIQNIFEDHSLMQRLEMLVSIVFKVQKVISDQGIEFVLSLFSSKNSELQKLGIFSLYQLAISLKESSKQQNIKIFQNDTILQNLVLLVKDKRNQQNLNQTVMQDKLIKQSDSVWNNLITQETNQLRIVALQILVIVAEFEHASFLKEKESEGVLGNPIEGHLIQKIFLKVGLLEILIQRLLMQPASHKQISDKELRLIARAMAALPAEALIVANIPIFSLSTLTQQSTNVFENDDQSPFGVQFVGINHQRPNDSLSKAQRGSLTTQNSSGSLLNLMSFFKALTTIIVKHQDASASYYALHAALCFIYAIDLRAPTVNGSRLEQPVVPGSNKSTQLAHDLSLLTVKDLDYNLLTACLTKSRLIQICMGIPAALHMVDDDLMRVASKFIITLFFKAHRKRILVGQLPTNQPQLKDSLVDLYKRLKLNFASEKREIGELLKNFIEKMFTFEIKDISRGGHVQFIHLVSQIVMHTSNPVISREERLHLLPTKQILVQLTSSFSASLDSQHINEVIESLTKRKDIKAAEEEILRVGSAIHEGGPSALNSDLNIKVEEGAKEELETDNERGEQDRAKPARILFYKFFFFNYLLQIVSPDIIVCLMQTKISDAEGLDFASQIVPALNLQRMDLGNQTSENKSPSVNSDASPDQHRNAKNFKIVQDLVHSLLLVVQTLRSRKMNYRFDQIIKPYKLEIDQLNDQQQMGPQADLNHANNSSKRSEESKGAAQRQQRSRRSHLSSQQQNLSENAEAEAEKKKKQAEQESETLSTSLSIVKMSLENIEKILQMVQDSPLGDQFDYELHSCELEGLTNLLTEFESNGDIVEGVYRVLKVLLSFEKISKQPSIQQTHSLVTQSQYSAIQPVGGMGGHNRQVQTQQHVTVATLDQSKELMRQAIKHSAVFQCADAFHFLNRLINLSARFKNKDEMQTALKRVAPQSVKEQLLQQNQSRSINSGDQSQIVSPQTNQEEEQKQQSSSQGGGGGGAGLTTQSLLRPRSSQSRGGQSNNPHRSSGTNKSLVTTTENGGRQISGGRNQSRAGNQG